MSGRALMIGGLLGLAFGIFIYPLQIAGSYLAQEMGLSIASLSDPSHRWPWVLPNGAVLYTSTENNSEYEDAEIRVVPPGGGESQFVIGGTNPKYLPQGFLTFTRLSSIYAAPFDLDRLEVTGPAV